MKCGSPDAEHVQQVGRSCADTLLKPVNSKTIATESIGGKAQCVLMWCEKVDIVDEVVVIVGG